MSTSDITRLKITDPSEDLVCSTHMKFRTFGIRWTIENYDTVSKTVKLFKSPEFPEAEEEPQKWYVEFEPVEVNPDNEKKFKFCVKRMPEDGDIYVDNVLCLQNKSQQNLFLQYYKGVLNDGDYIFYSPTERDVYNELLWNKNSDNSLIIISKIRVFDSTQPVPEHAYRKISSKSFESIDLLQDISKLLDKDQTFQDVTISVQGKTFGAHKNILAARSEVFAAMFTNEMSEKSNSLVEIEDLTPEVIAKMLHFIYNDKVDESELKEYAPELLAAAEKYNLRRLREMCIGAMHKNLSVKNVVKTLEVADVYSVSDLKKEALRFLLSHRRMINSWEEFKTLIAARTHLMVELIHIQDNIPENPSD